MPDPKAPPLPILYLDDTLVVASKPSGMLVHRAASDPGAPVLLQTLKAQLGRWLYPVQRLDRGTSGAIAYAFESATAAALQQAMTSPCCRKDYLALVRGYPRDHFEARHALADERGIAREAHTAFRTLARWRGAALVRARIFTGRANQIRRHLADLGHSVLGDPTFGRGRLNQLFQTRFGLPRMFLHATRICFEHPTTGVRLRIRDRLPSDLRAVLHALPHLVAHRRPEDARTRPGCVTNDVKVGGDRRAVGVPEGGGGAAASPPATPESTQKAENPGARRFAPREARKYGSTEEEEEGAQEGGGGGGGWESAS